MNYREAIQFFYLSAWYQRAQPSLSFSTKSQRHHFSTFGGRFLPLGLTNLQTEDTEGLFMALLRRFPLGLPHGLLLPQLGELCLDLLNLDRGF